MPASSGNPQNVSGPTLAPLTGYLYIVLLSAVVLIPCFWQAHIQCTDLPSHLYNAWLRTQVAAGRLPGLVIVHQKTNFLADTFLTIVLQRWGAWWAEHLLVVSSVMIFFWGTFRFITSLSQRRPWQITSLLVMLTYGVVYRYGFFNFYLSLGLCMWAASLVKSRYWPHRLSVLLLYLLAIAAHPMPPLWIAAVMLYLHVAKRLEPAKRLWVFAAALAVILAGHFVCRYLLLCYWPGFALHTRRYAGFIGVGQLAPNLKYVIVIGLVLLLWAPVFWRMLQHLSLESFSHNVVSQLVVLHVFGSILAPDALIHISGYHIGFGLIGVRLSLMTAVMICALVTPIDLPRWHIVAMICVTGLFFFFAYVDGRAENEMEAGVEAITAALPRGARVVITLRDSPHGIGQTVHLLDRPCIGRCFDYANYEPSSGQFSLRANGPNAYVMFDEKDIEDFGAGKYIVKRNDVPLYRIYLCRPHQHDLCVDRAAVGEVLATQQISMEPELWKR